MNQADATSYAYSKQEAINHLKEMHQKWKGEGIGKIDEWVSRTAQGSYGGHKTTIFHPNSKDAFGIEANIEPHFGGPNKNWRIETTFFWTDPK